MYKLIRVMKFMKFPLEETGKEELGIKRYIIISLKNKFSLGKKGLWLIHDFQKVPVQL